MLLVFIKSPSDLSSVHDKNFDIQLAISWLGTFTSPFVKCPENNINIFSCNICESVLPYYLVLFFLRNRQDMIGMYYKINRKYRICRSFVCINGCIILKTYRVKSFGSVLWKNWHIPRIGFMTAYYAVSSYGFIWTAINCCLFLFQMICASRYQTLQNGLISFRRGNTILFMTQIYADLQFYICNVSAYIV